MAVEMFPKTEDSIVKEAQFDPKAVEPQPKPQSKFKEPKIIISIVVLIVILTGVFFVYLKFFKSTEEENSNTSEVVSCLEGVDGNSGDNYCSNIHTSASKCTPGLENTYEDGCTK